MAKGQAYRFHCINHKCGAEFHRWILNSDFEVIQYSPSGNGFTCWTCGFPKMAVIKSNKVVKDSFKPGWQPNIRKYCSTYGQYKAELKELGLIEIGHEELKEHNGKVEYWTDEMLKKLYDKGIEINPELAKDLNKEHG